LDEVVGDRPVVACLAMLADKDASAMVRALVPVLDYAVCTELDPATLEARGLPGVRSHAAGELAAACAEAGIPAGQQPELTAALRRGRELARERAEGVLLVTGSHYLLAPARTALALCED
jgi:dihydrofolate synthase/folylpolyglutamate synthase